MVKNRMLRVVITSVLLSVLVVCLTAVIASAHTVTVNRASGVSVNASATPASGTPNSNIVQKSGEKAHYNPSSLSCKASTKLSFDITNQTSVSQSVMYNGRVLTVIAPGKHQGFSIQVPGTYYLHLKGSTSMLTVTAS